MSAIGLILLILNLLALAIIVRSILSWVDPRQSNPVSQFLVMITEPILAPIRRLLGNATGGWDLSPMIAVLVIYVIEAALGGRF